MRRYTPSELHHLKENVSYGVDPALLSGSSTSLVKPEHAGMMAGREKTLGWVPPEGGVSSDASPSGEGDTGTGEPEDLPEETFWESIPVWVKVTGLIGGAAGLTFAGWKINERRSDVSF